MVEWIRTSRLSIKNSFSLAEPVGEGLAAGLVSSSAEASAVSAVLSLGKNLHTDGRCKATWKREFKLPWREAGPPNHHDDIVDSDQEVVKKQVSLCLHTGLPRP